MPTLAEIAAGKAQPPLETRGSFRVGGEGSEPAAVEHRSVSNQHQPPAWEPEKPKEESRLLGTENRSDVIPFYPPNPDVPTQAWQSATLCPRSSLGIVMSQTSPRIGWIACYRHGEPPLLLFPLPLLGTLEAELPAPLLPSEMLPGTVPDGRQQNEHPWGAVVPAGPDGHATSLRGNASAREQ